MARVPRRRPVGLAPIFFQGANKRKGILIVQTYSLNALAESFEVDRSTMLRAMRGTPPDEVKKGNRPAWKTSTAARALERHHRKKHSHNDDDSYRLGLVDKIEAAFDELDRKFERLKAEADLEKRRALSLKMQVGKTINGIEELFKAVNKMDEDGCLMQIVSDKLVNTARSQLIELVELWDDVYAVRAEVEAERRTEAS
jgi:hypothetical protein